MLSLERQLWLGIIFFVTLAGAWLEFEHPVMSFAACVCALVCTGTLAALETS